MEQKILKQGINERSNLIVKLIEYKDKLNIKYKVTWTRESMIFKHVETYNNLKIAEAKYYFLMSYGWGRPKSV